MQGKKHGATRGINIQELLKSSLMNHIYRAKFQLPEILLNPRTKGKGKWSTSLPLKVKGLDSMCQMWTLFQLGKSSQGNTNSVWASFAAIPMKAFDATTIIMEAFTITTTNPVKNSTSIVSNPVGASIAIATNLVDMSWKSSLLDAFVETLCRFHSNHYSLFLSCGDLPSLPRPLSFCFKAS